MKIRILSESPEETQKIACFFVQAVLKGYLINFFKNNSSLAISLEGELGSGKTEFLKGAAKTLRLKEKIFSPTFVIMKSFSLKTKSFESLWHIDCYRLKKIKEMEELGFKNIVKNKKNLVFVEWGDKIKKILPKNHLTIKFKMIDKNKRQLEFIIP